MYYIGFNYSGGNFDRDYAFRICYWMALMNGKRKDIITEDENEYKNVPYVIYDGCEDIPVIIGKEQLRDCSVVDEYGFKEIPTFFRKKIPSYFEKELLKINEAEKIIKSELIRLTKLYNK